VNLDLAETAHRAARDGEAIGAKQVCARPLRLLGACPDGLKTPRRFLDVLHQFIGGPRRTLLDFAVALLRSAGITRNVLPLQGPLEPAGMTVGISSQVREHVTDSPAGQPARLPGGVIIDASGGHQEPLMGLPAESDRDIGFKVHADNHRQQDEVWNSGSKWR
jgi:hypothetical protein